MNGLPGDLDLSPLAGAVLEQLCFGEHQLQLVFGPEIRIAVEGACELTTRGLEPREIDDFAIEATALCELLGRRIRQAVRTPSGGLAIAFEEGGVLEFMIDSPDFEAFQIHIGDRVYIA